VSTPALEKGAEVTCPRCGLHIATVTRDCFHGEAMSESMFEATPKVEGKRPIRTGTLAVCCDCGEQWADMPAGKVHTREGWRP
jgi:uncharacterized protein (DUF983 family)